MNGLPIVGRTNIPPCGALSVHSKNMDSPPATAEPMIQDGKTRNGSLAAKGMAPSEIKDSPRI